MTFSIVAYDPANGDLGVAVQSKFPNVGASIPFARTGVGAVATQSYCNTGFGPRGLALLEHGATPLQALEILTASDPQRAYRQVGIVDAQGRAASFTGAHCFDWAGDRQGLYCAAQGNTLTSPEVVASMVRSIEDAQGSLAERLLAALQAGQASGGDRRGQHSRQRSRWCGPGAVMAVSTIDSWTCRSATIRGRSTNWNGCTPSAV